MLSSEKIDEYKIRSEKITIFLRSELTNDEGILSQGKNGDFLSSELLIDDFGDVAPFIALYGGEDLCLTHLEYIENNIEKLGFTRAFAYTDLILGLVWYARLGKESDRALSLAKRLAKQAEDIWYRNGKIYSAKVFGLLTPLTNGIDTTFIEVWSEMYRSTKDVHYLDLLKKTTKQFSEIVKDSEGEVIPLHYVSKNFRFIFTTLFPRKFSGADVMKDNTNYLFALLDVIKLGVDIASTWKSFDVVYSSLAKKVSSESLSNNFYRESTSNSLLPSFAFIDVSCDAYNLRKDRRYLNYAIKLADYWLSIDTETKLFPKNKNLNESYFDSETDMSVALLKLYYLTGDNKYYKKSVEIVDAIDKFHKFEGGYALQVDVNNGKITNYGVKTKFVALHIKSLHLLSENKSLYEDDELFMLSKDR